MGDAPDDRIDLSNENDSVREMVEWFFARYEDPVENCPRNDGEFAFIWGGPYLAEELIGNEFDHEDQADIDRAIHLINEMGTEWAEKPPKTIGQVAELLHASVDDVLFVAEEMGRSREPGEDGWSNEDIKKAEDLLYDDSEGVRIDIRRLIRRGNVTQAELAELRCNSWEREALVPKMNDEAFIMRVKHTLANCSIGTRPFCTYDDAMCGLYGPELLKRFQSAVRAARDYAEVIDNVREALGQKSTHYLVIADDVKWIVDAVERESPRAKDILLKLRGEPGSGNGCQACNIESEIGSEENPHPVPERFHVCGRSKS